MTLICPWPSVLGYLIFVRSTCVKHHQGHTAFQREWRARFRNCYVIAATTIDGYRKHLWFRKHRIVVDWWVWWNRRPLRRVLFEFKGLCQGIVAKWGCNICSSEVGMPASCLLHFVQAGVLIDRKRGFQNSWQAEIIFCWYSGLTQHLWRECGARDWLTRPTWHGYRLHRRKALAYPATPPTTRQGQEKKAALPDQRFRQGYIRRLATDSRHT